MHVRLRHMLRRVTAISAALLLLLTTVMSAGALDNRYRFDELGMSVGVPKSFSVITVNSERGDEVFSQLNMDYDETITAFRNADIYLRAYDPGGIYQISMTVTADDQSRSINNYLDLTEAERKNILTAFQSEPSVTSAVEVKHGGSLFFDSSRTAESDGKTLYINHCNAIINGMQIDLSLQKSDDPILPDEAKALTNLASSLEFDSITRKDTGPLFDWWRILLWVVILVVLSVVISMSYKKHNQIVHQRIEEHRRQRAAASGRTTEIPDEEPQGEPITFDEALGYGTEDEFAARSAADLDSLESYDISVRERDPNSGINYFEDDGSSIDNAEDYFESFFKEPTETRSGIMRLMVTVGAYIQIAARHVGYFFKNLWKKITGRKS
jgi:hypothetical protein